MKVTLYMAMSVNGYIARENGDEDFISHENWETLGDLAREYGCLVIGRKTFEAVKMWGEEYSFDSFKDAEKVIVTRNKNFQAGENYTIADSPQEAVERLSGRGFERILVTGGATINSAFMKEGLIDEMILNVEPFVLGRGIRLFTEENFENKLKFISAEEIGGGIIQLRYKKL